MTRRIPILPTLFVAAACATMIGLGGWQLQRAKWKDGLLEGYKAAANLPEIAYPAFPLKDGADRYYYRRAGGMCLAVTGWRAVSGRNVKGMSGWAHIAECSTGAEGPGMPVDVGWSKSPANPMWAGGDVNGMIAPDRKSVFRLVSSKALAPGLDQSEPPSLEAIPNNHMAYAIQWFLFAGVAAMIYALALRLRKPV
jgi:surfeit locus 1 family protein